MNIETRYLKSGCFCSHATHGGVTMTCTNKNKQVAIEKAVSGLNSLLKCVPSLSRAISNEG